MREQTAVEKMWEEDRNNAVFPDFDRYKVENESISLNQKGFQDYCCKLFRIGGMSQEDFVMLAKQNGWWKAPTADDRDDAIKSALEFLKNQSNRDKDDAEKKNEVNEYEDDIGPGEVFDDLDDTISTIKKTKIKPLFPNLKYPTSGAFSPNVGSTTGTYIPNASAFGNIGGLIPGASQGGKKDDGAPDVPKEAFFELPLWIGRNKEGAMMKLLNKIYEGHGEKPYNGVLVIESAIREWLTSSPNPSFYLSLGGMSDHPPTTEIAYDPVLLVWDIPCKLHGIEFFDRLKEEKHGTPLRAILSIECKKDYMVAKEIHKNGRLFLKGDCETEFDDIVKFRIRGLCYVEWRDTNDSQILIDTEPPIQDMPF
jgi:hypothetical protein